VSRHILIGTICAVLITCTSCNLAPRTEAETWAFCGPNPTSSFAGAQLETLANYGIDAVFGPCLPPDWSTYSPANPGQRYATPADYLHLVQLAATNHMKVIVYDAQLWSDDPLQRQQAIDRWSPWLSSIRAWDMGDEFDPATPDWTTLIHRWRIIEAEVTPRTGVGPFTNHLGTLAVLVRAVLDMPEQARHLSYDNYDVDESLKIAAQVDGHVDHLMCSINTITHGALTPTSSSVENDMQDHRDAGCDSFLIFGGAPAAGTPGLDAPSLVTDTGAPTALLVAVERGAQ
jgi:hypothetical protein